MEVQLQPDLNFKSRKGGCSALSSGRFVPQKEWYKSYKRLGELEWTKSRPRRYSIPGLLSPEAVTIYSIKMKLNIYFVKHR
jgi:hypothetical protein